jgi:uncharacterized PurR-regulated membrane protein YhhQ (DUF165 family)
MPTRQHDRWLLPRRQTEYPARNFLSESKLHARREATFLVLSMVFAVALTVLLALGTARLIDVGEVVASLVPDVRLPVTLQVSFGALPAALGFFAVLLACELYGRRRAAALLWVGGFASLALVGLARLADVLDGRDTALLPTAALAAGVLTAHVTGLVVFAALRHHLRGRNLVSRALLASLIAQPLGWLVFGATLYVARAQYDVDAMSAIGLGTCAYTLACMLLLTVPLAIAARALSLFLRIRFEDTTAAHVLPPALIIDVDDEDDEPEPEPVVLAPRAKRVSLEPFSSAEMRFFTEGDQLEPTRDFTQTAPGAPVRESFR